jgi:hypothetical protein
MSGLSSLNEGSIMMASEWRQIAGHAICRKLTVADIFSLIATRIRLIGKYNNVNMSVTAMRK